MSAVTINEVRTIREDESVYAIYTVAHQEGEHIRKITQKMANAIVDTWEYRGIKTVSSNGAYHSVQITDCGFCEDCERLAPNIHDGYGWVNVVYPICARCADARAERADEQKLADKYSGDPAYWN